MSAMSLANGTRLGPYEITGVIGAGGMGEVYRARDTTLDRDVAIKVLPDLFASDQDRLARFEREAKTLAALNHPNIAHIYGLEAGRALVMELVDGETLAQRLARGPIPLEDAVPIARQIVDALELAHDQGIIHRDLKPANVAVRADGTVKVLDFGLAKALTAAGSPGGLHDTPLAQGFGPDRDNFQTFTSPAMTQLGVILGTAAYMSPEQARGKPADRRADIWAFGCVLYEMLTARRPFAGDDVSLTLAAVLKEQVDFTALPAETPAPIRRLLRRCLEKDPKKRLSSINDARLELDEEDTPGWGGGLADASAARPTGAAVWRLRLMWGAAGALVAAVAMAAVLASRSRAVDARPVVRSQIAFPDTPLLLSGQRALALTPDGSAVVFSGVRPGEPQRLYRRSLADETVTALPGMEEASSPSFSPDGRLAFHQRGRLKTTRADGGAPVDGGEAWRTLGGSFAPDGTLIFNRQHGEGLLRLSPGSTTPEVVTTVNRGAGEAGHHWPYALPDSRHVLYTAEIDGKPYSEARIMLLSLETRQSQLLIDGGTDARYMPTGHIVFWRLGDLWSVPFDLSSRRLRGPAVAVVRGVMLAEANGNAHYTVASDGTMLYVPGHDPESERALVLVDRSGAARPLTTERKAYADVAVSPDGTRLASTVIAANDSLWTLEMDRGTPTRITFEAENSRPVWSPDGTRLAFARYFGDQVRQLHTVPVDGGAAPQLLRPSDRTEFADSWSRVGDVLAFTRVEEATRADIWVMSAGGDRKARAWLPTRFKESQARFSHDGRWIAYVSNESGRFEVYVRSYPDGAHKRQVSFDGGEEPRWRADGLELFYRRQGAVLAADVTTAGAELRFSVPRVLFKDQYVESNSSSSGWGAWDVLPDGRRFVFIQDFAQPRSSVTLVQNWFEELKRTK